MHNRTSLAAAVACCLASIVLVTPAAQAACDRSDLSRLADRAEGVFVGTVIRADGDEVRVRISDVYRGDPGPVVRVVDRPAAGEDPVALRRGDQYLFLASGRGAAWTTSGCDGTGAVSDSRLATVERALGPPTARRGDARTETLEPASAETSQPANPTGEADTARSGNGAKVVVGIVVVALLVGSFFLPRLRRRNRRRD